MPLSDDFYSRRPVPVFLLSCLLGLTCLSSTAGAADSENLARQILDATGVSGGVVVHLQCGDGRLTAALGGDGYLVHGLDTDPANVAAAREHVKSLGNYGPVSVDGWDGKHLPYIDDFVNLVVAKDLDGDRAAEVTRVLCPGGVAYVKLSGEKGWQKRVKPWPDGIDEWTHFLHSADNNAVAHDRVVGPPRRMQWVGGPRYSRHHDKMSSVSAVVSAAGRVFYIMDEAPDVSILTAPEWNLVARDAFNGTILWRRPIGPWHSHLHGLKSGPADLPRKLVTDGHRVYVTLGLGEPLVALDAATGSTIRTYQQTQNTEEFVCSSGVLFVQSGTADARPKSLAAIEAESGSIVWTTTADILRGTLAADDSRVAFVAGDRIVCVNRTSGKQLWQSPPIPLAEKYPDRFTPTLVLYDDVVLFAGGEFAAEGNRSWDVGKDDTLTAICAERGELLWSAPHPLSGYASSEDLLVVNGVVWIGETTSGHAVGNFTGRDVHTGEVTSSFDPDVDTYWFHHRCYRGKATDKYLLMSRTGVEFIDVEKQSWSINHWVRGACLYGVMPANGLLYAPQHPCACYLESKMYGFNALAPGKEDGESGRGGDGESEVARLERGPAYTTLIPNPSSPIPPSTDWPTYRHDTARSGSATSELPAELDRSWSTELGGRLSAPVVAGGRVLVASVDTHTAYALDAGSGRRLWQFTAGGRIDSPPTCWGENVLFGSADGYVYSLRAGDGQMAWRFRAAPSDRRLMSFEQIESVWPVPGNVLVHDGVAWFVAGRSMFLDGGLRLVRLDAATGKLLSETVMDDSDPAAGKMVQDYARQQNMPVALPDVLSCDGRLVYMRSQPFELDGTRLPLEALPYEGNPEKFSIPSTQRAEHAHLFSPTGFVDDTWWHRTYWIYGSRFLGGWAGYTKAGQVTPGGRILVFDDENVYGFGRKPQYYRWTTPIEHQLFSAPKEPPVAAVDAAPKPTRGGPKPARVQHNWTADMPIFARAMILAGGTLFVAGPADLVDEDTAQNLLDDAEVQAQIRRQREAFAGAAGGTLQAVSTEDGQVLSELSLDTIPVFDGMAAAESCIYMSTVDGRVICLGRK